MSIKVEKRVRYVGRLGGAVRVKLYQYCTLTVHLLVATNEGNRLKKKNQQHRRHDLSNLNWPICTVLVVVSLIFPSYQTHHQRS